MYVMDEGNWLSRQQEASKAMGYIRGFIHGAVVGAAAGLCLAPQDGARTRAQLRSKAESLRGSMERAQGTAAKMAPVVETTKQRAIVVAGKARRSLQRDDARGQMVGAGMREHASAASEWPTE
jgi:gas vesicle protein